VRDSVVQVTALSSKTALAQIAEAEQEAEQFGEGEGFDSEYGISGLDVDEYTDVLDDEIVYDEHGRSINLQGGFLCFSFWHRLLTHSHITGGFYDEYGGYIDAEGNYWDTEGGVVDTEGGMFTLVVILELAFVLRMFAHRVLTGYTDVNGTYFAPGTWEEQDC
jgi:hypothetical protein